MGSCENTQVCFDEISAVADAIDEQLGSGYSYWQFKTFKDFTCTGGSGLSFYNEDDSLQEIKVKALTRTYIKAAQGKILKTHFDTANGNFSATIQIDGKIDAPTLVYVNNHGKGDHWYKFMTVELGGEAADLCNPFVYKQANLVTVILDSDCFSKL